MPPRFFGWDTIENRLRAGEKTLKIRYAQGALLSTRKVTARVRKKWYNSIIKRDAENLNKTARKVYPYGKQHSHLHSLRHRHDSKH